MTGASFFQAVPFTLAYPRARFTAASAIFATIALERFAWYAMLGEVEVWDHGGSGVIGNLLLASYLLPLLGGWLSGKRGLRGVCLAGCATLVAGYALAALSLPLLAFALLALGCGLFKPCLAALLGNLEPPGPERAKNYSRYYCAIQIGSLLSTPVGAALRLRWGFSAAFGVCGMAAAAACAVLLISWHKLAPQNPVVEAVLESEQEQPADWKRLAFFLLGASLFYAGLQQQQTTMVKWAKDVCESAVPEVVGTLNPLFCLGLLLVPAVAGWHDLRRRALLAGLSLASAFALLTLAGPSLGWVVGWYALATVGEALLSPLGMSHVSAAVPRRLAGTASALWLLSLAVGGKLAGVMGSLPLHTAITASILTSLAAALVLWLALSHRTKEKH